MQLHRAKDRIEAAGGTLTLIGQASPRHAAHFRRRLELDFPVLADGDRATYKLVGAGRGSIGNLLGPESVLKGVRAAARSGTMQGKIIGDASQLGATLIVRPGGEVAWAHTSRNPGDNPPVDELVEHVRAAAGA